MGGGCVSQHAMGCVCPWVWTHPPGRHLPWTPPPHTPRQTPPSFRDHWSGRYASYWNAFFSLVSLHIRNMWETTVMHKQVSGWTVNFGPNSPVYPLLWNTPPPHFGKLQIWDDQSLLRNTPPPWKSSDLGCPKFTPKYPPPWKSSDLGCPKFTPKYPPPMENFRFGMPKVYSKIPPLWWKTSDLGCPKFTPK